MPARCGHRCVRTVWKQWMSDPVSFEKPLDARFYPVFTGQRSEERTPNGAVRMGLRPKSHTADEAQRIQNRTELTAISDRVRTAPSGETRTTGSRHRDRATGQGARSNRVARCLRESGEDGDLWSRSGNRAGLRGDRTEQRPSGRCSETGQWCRTKRPGNTPTEPWTGGSAWHQF